MKAETTLFPYGGAEGLPVLRLDAEGQPWSDEAAALALARARPPGLFAAWITGVADWHARDFMTWVTRTPDLGLPLISLRDLDAQRWIGGVANVLDASAAMQCSGPDELADFLAARAHSVPEIEDLVVRVGPDTRAPSASVLEVLAEFCQPQDQGYVYAPRDHKHWALLERVVAMTSSMWALRGSG